MLDVFVEAAIKMESPLGDTRPRTPWGGLTGYYSGIGLAKVSDAEMEGEYGKLVDDEHQKVGLGLRNKPCDKTCIMAMDQADPGVAAIAMKVRISMRLDVCVKNGCTSTDMIMVALLAADERVTHTTLNQAFRMPNLAAQSNRLHWIGTNFSMIIGRNPRTDEKTNN